MLTQATHRISLPTVRVRRALTLALVAGSAALLSACSTPAPEQDLRPPQPPALVEGLGGESPGAPEEFKGGGQEERATTSYTIFAPAELGQGSPAVALVRATITDGAAASASAASASAASASAAPASAAPASAAHEGAFEGLELFVRSSDGRVGRRAPLVVPPGRSPEPRIALGSQVRGAGPSARPAPPQVAPNEAYALAAFGLATGAAPGPAAIYLARGDEILAQASLVIVRRSFRTEILRLNRALTSIRVDPDPEKTAQAERYLALLAAVNPEANYLDGGFVSPVRGTRRTSLFGDRRRFIYADGSEAWGQHNGVDYGYPTGTPVYVPAPGRVVMAEDRIVTGQTIVLEHLPGVYTIYMHLSRMDLAPGQIAKRGQSLGAVGATGLATGPHLHWELRILGVAADPEAWLGIDKIPDIRTIAVAFEGG